MDEDIVRRLERDIEQLETRLGEYLLKAIFEESRKALDQRLRPLERIVYGLVGLVMITFATAVLSLVIVR